MKTAQAKTITLPLVWSLALLSGLVLFGAGCAKMGDPAPPTVRIPEAVSDLTVQQLSDHVVLKISKPARNTDGSAIETLRSMEVYRFAEKISNSKSSPMAPDQFAREATPIFSIPENRFSEHLNDAQFVIEDKLLVPNRSEIYSYLFRYAVLFFNKKSQTAGFSNQAAIAPIPIPSPPEKITADIAETFIDLKWSAPLKNMDGSNPAKIAGYKIFRSEDSHKFPSTPINPEPVKGLGFKDAGFQFDRTYFYRISVVGSLQNPYAESLPSEALKVEPKDIFPPDAPTKLQAVPENGVVYLLWTAPIAKDVAGYHTYRRQPGSSEKQLLLQGLITNPSFQDAAIQPGREYEYLLTAVDNHGNESAPAQVKIQIP
jgi:hypothetical protein